MLTTFTFLPPAYVVRREGNVLTRVCPSICLSTGGVPISHNALQHFPECHGAAGQGGYPARSSWGGYPGGGVPWPGGYPGWGGYPGRGDTLAGGIPWPGGYPGQGGTLLGGYPGQGGYPARGGTQLGQHREYLLHGRRYASCVHAGGLSFFNMVALVLQIHKDFKTYRFVFF